MKINVKEISYSEFLKLPGYKYSKPKRRSILLATVIRVVSGFELLKYKFKVNKINMDKISKKEPCLILMNHSCFLDLKIASKILYPKKYNIVCTDDGFVGKESLMRHIGCIPTKKFVTDPTLVRDMIYAFKTLKSSVLMYPEAGYSFDGTSIPLPSNIGKALKLLKVPVVIITTHGAYLRDPLYNNLQLRKPIINVDMECVLTKEDISNLSENELRDIVLKHFSFDNFKWQQENKVKVDEPFRADGLNRILYKCPHCLKESKMEGKGTKIICHACGEEYTLDEYGYLVHKDNASKFTHIPDWYKWEREEVLKEIKNNNYKVEVDVEIYALKDMKHIYKLGDGHLLHDNNGFILKSDDGELEYIQNPLASYTINSDFNWYERGDIISIGDNNARFYCLVKDKVDVATKVRFAAEELYKLNGGK